MITLSLRAQLTLPLQLAKLCIVKERVVRDANMMTGNGVLGLDAGWETHL